MDEARCWNNSERGAIPWDSEVRTCTDTAAKVRHGLRIAAKAGDMLLHPAEAQLLVMQPIVRRVSRIAHCTGCHEPKRSKPVAFGRPASVTDTHAHTRPLQIV